MSQLVLDGAKARSTGSSRGSVEDGGWGEDCATYKKHPGAERGQGLDPVADRLGACSD